MKTTKIISILLCILILAVSLSSCTEMQVGGNSTSESSDPSDVTSAHDADGYTEPGEVTSSEVKDETDTEAVPSEEETTAAPEPEIEPMQIPEYYKIGVTTEFPLIATLGGEKVEVTLRAATMSSTYDVRWMYIDAVRDGKVIYTKTFRSIGQLMTTTEKSEFFALLRAIDNPAHGTANISFVTYSLTDAQGKLDIYCVDGFNATLSVGLNVNVKQPMQDAVQHGRFRSFRNQVKLEDFQNKHGSLCMVLDSLSDPDNEISAYPSDNLPIYDIENLAEHPFFIEKKEQYDNYYALTQVLLSIDKVSPKIPEGMMVDINSMRCTDETLTIDGVDYKVAYRTLKFLDAAGNVCGTYTDYVSFYDLNILSFEITQ